MNVPVFILAGGLGTRLSEETQVKPKPMVEIGEIPILVHIMRWYYAHGFDDFVVCAGYRSWEIKHFFLNYEARMNHLVIDHRTSLSTPPTSFGQRLEQERWKVRVVDTGADCQTGGRLARALDVISADQAFDDFAMTYGDGLCDVDLKDELAFHRAHGTIGTVLAVHAQQRFGVLKIDPAMKVSGFLEKPDDKQHAINGGFFFFKKAFRRYLDDGQDCVLERRPMERLVEDGGLMSFKHSGFWYSMDTLRDKTHLEDLWRSGAAPWVKSLARVSV